MVILVLALATGPRAEAQELQQKVAAAKQAAAQNQKSLRNYSWLETTEIAVKGEVKNSKVESLRYGPDGTVQKTVVQASPPRTGPEARAAGAGGREEDGGDAAEMSGKQDLDASDTGRPGQESPKRRERPACAGLYNSSIDTQAATR